MAYLTSNDNLEIARGNVDRLSSVNKFGANVTSADGVVEDIWDGSGVYPFPVNTFATGTAQCTSCIATNTVTINGLEYVGVTGIAGTNQFSVDTSDAATAISLATAVNTDIRTGTAGTVSASPSTDTVTLTSSLEGTLGNAITLAQTGGTITLSGASFTGGVFEVITKLSQTTNQAAMVGANIEVQGLDINWDMSTEVIALDGSDTTTPVVLTTPLIRVFRMKILANVVSDQPIRAHNDAENVDYAIISIGKNQTLMALFTTPRNRVGYITNYYFSYIRDTVKDPDSVNYGLWTADRGNGYAFQIKNEQGLPKQTTATPHEFKPYMTVGEKTDIKVTSLADGAAASVQAGFDIILEEM